MDAKFTDEIYDMFVPKADEGRDKVASLESAIKEYIKPGMNLYISPEGQAALCQLVRQFWRTKPNFVLTMAGITEQALSLVHCGLVKKLITTGCSHSYPSPV